MVSAGNVKELRRIIGVGSSVANELLMLSGDDLDLAVDASVHSPGLDQCKAAIIDGRFRKLEEKVGKQDD